MTFNAAAVSALFSAVVSEAQQLGVFAEVRQHEPKNAPTASGLTLAVWLQGIKPTRASGLAAVSGVVGFRARIYSNMLAEPQDGIDPELLAAAGLLMETYSGSFTLGGTVRNVDLFGSEGTALAAEAGYIQHDNRMFRVMEISLAVIVNDMWDEVA